ncbi:MAG: hypothetical protein KAU14_07040, partial [Thermoplasmata archaeon]|nr:hypothetical protein [Thermoplasmata archaeon]
GFATVTFTPELSKKIKDPLTTLVIKIEIDAESEIIESDEDNNVVSNDLEVMKVPKAAPGYDASLWMVLGIIGLGVVLAAGAEWKRRRKKESD